MRINAECRQAGFTLVEVMIAVVLASIVGLSVGSLLIFANRALIRNSRAVELQRDAGIAMEVIDRGICTAKVQAGNVDFIGSTLYFDFAQTTGVQEINGTLIWLPSQTVLVSDEWNILQFDAVRHDNGTWRVILDIQDPQTRQRQILVSSFLPRNH